MEENLNELNKLDIEEIKKDTCFFDYHKTSSVISYEDSVSQIEELNLKFRNREIDSKLIKLLNNLYILFNTF